MSQKDSFVILAPQAKVLVKKSVHKQLKDSLKKVVGVGYTGHFLMKLFRLLTLIFFPVQYDKTNTKVKKI